MQKPELHLLQLSGCSIFEQLQIEEAFFRVGKGNACLINQGSDPSVVLGISCKQEEHLSLRPSIPVIQRFSGGGSVVVDSNTVFISFICNSETVGIAPFPKEVLHWTKNFYTPLIPRFSIRDNDYVIEEKKFGGNAQYFSRDRFVHHSTLLWDYEPDLMKLLSLPPRMPEYRNRRSHSEFLCRLKEYLPCRLRFVEDFVENLGRHFFVKRFEMEDVREILKIPHRKGLKKLL